jgi:asparagine synthase (glutamine-hydrolysing)
MCGLAGYYVKNAVESNSEVIYQMLKLQRHRGPDDTGILGIQTQTAEMQELAAQSVSNFAIAPNLVFGFNRLSILDLSSAGHQPMIDEPTQVALMMNGEVYNAFDFTEELSKLGYVLKSKSDTEIVLKLYLAFGIEGMLQRLNGMFAIAIYDGRSKSFFLIRDRVGIKPLYVLKRADVFAFASEMKSFKALPNFKFELDEAQLSEFLLFRNSINQTLFKDIVNITPGTYWQIDAAGAVSIKTYFDICTERQMSGHITKQMLQDTLQAAIQRQMISDVKLGCQLSGGVDSSLVTAMAAQSIPEHTFETVSIVFDEKGFSEKGYIDFVAQTLHLKSHQFTLNATAYLDMLDEATWHFEQPLNHPNTIGIKLLSQEAKKKVTVLLSGEGADESLAGYSRFLPGNGQFWSLATFKKLIKNKTQLLPFLNAWSDQSKRYILQTAFGSFSSAALLYPSFSAKAAIQSRVNVWNAIEDKPLRKQRKYELLTYLPDLLMRQDKMSMAHTIENRVPFLDNEMLQVALSCSDSALIQEKKGRQEGKYLLKEICAAYFGENFAYRDKMGFGIPLKTFFMSEAFQKRWTEELLPGIRQRGIFRIEPLLKWMKHPELLTAEQLDAIWLMTGFEIWAKQYLD